MQILGNLSEIHFQSLSSIEVTRNKANNMSEQRRIQFLLERDGLEATKAFVVRTMQAYRKAVVSRTGLGAAPEYRTQMVNSYVVFKRFLGVVNE